jgi:hypothetical protein
MSFFQAIQQAQIVYPIEDDYSSIEKPEDTIQTTQTAIKRLWSESFSDDTILELKKRRRRTCYPYASNLTIARLSQIAHDHGINPFAPDLSSWNQVIIDHAYRRIQLFYCQLLFYFKEDCKVTQAPTISQHGKGGCHCLSAAHSSILPNLHDDKTLMAVNLSLYHNMNSTIEMPEIVNLYDCVIEGQMRAQALALINCTSIEGLHPYEALEIFVEKIQDFFIASRKEIQTKLNLLSRIVSLEQELVKLETNQKEDPVTWIREYARCAYDLEEARQTLHSLKTFSIPVTLSKYDSTREEIFLRIWQECPNALAQLDQIKNHKLLRRFINRHPEFSPGNHSALHLKKNALRLAIKNYHPTDLWLKNEHKALQIYHRYKKLIDSSDQIPENLHFSAICKTEESLEVLELQAAGSKSPPFNYLSGKKIGSVLYPMNEKELLEQKICLQNSKIKEEDLIKALAIGAESVSIDNILDCPQF